MSTKYKIRNQDALHFISFATVEWVDVFTRPLYKEVIVESLKYCQQPWFVSTAAMVRIYRSLGSYLPQPWFVSPRTSPNEP